MHSATAADCRQPAHFHGFRALLVPLLIGAMLLTGTATAADAAAPSPTRTFLVDCHSTSSGNGSSRKPWNSLDAVTEHGRFSAGDVILLRRGTTCHGQLTLSGSGSAGHPIVLGTYGKGSKPLLAGDGTSDGSGTVQLADAQYWQIQDLHVTNQAKSGPVTEHRSGVLLINRTSGRLRGITVRRMSVDHVSSYPWVSAGMSGHRFGGISAITVSDVPSAGFDDLSILDNRVTRVGRSGIVVWNDLAWNTSARDTNVRISDNRVSWAAGDGILLVGAVRSRIDHNVAANGSNLPPCPLTICPDTRPTASAGIWPIYSSHLRIDHNEAYGTKWGPGDGEGFDIDNTTSDVIFEDNYAHDNAGGGLLFCGSTRVVARFNIFQNNAKSALVFIGSVPAKDTSIYNNTIYQSKASKAGTVRYFNGARGSGIRFFNNIVFNYAKGSYLWPTRPWSRTNTYVGVHRAGEPHGRGWSRVDPALVRPGVGRTGFGSLEGYRPSDPSRFRVGIAIPSSARVDFFGKRIDGKHPPRGAAD